MKHNKKRFIGAWFAGLVFGCLPASNMLAATPPTLQQRLDRVAERLEDARVAQHIPGLAIAIVKDDRVVMARGFGLADLEAETPVTDETLFAIGSSSKAFTATAIGMLVDEGRMSWDDPVAKWLPYFNPELDSDDEDSVILLRDMLCHATGFTRMGILWAGGEIPRETILRTANGAEPLVPYRSAFNYNNVMFMAAGMCAGEAADSTWETLITERIFKPLGMNDSSLTIEAAQADSRLALGYRWDDDTEVWERDHMRNIDRIGPAGSINSNVKDMAHWVRFQLGKGVFESNRLLSEDTHAETWTPQIRIAGDVHYGFGWMLRDWNGQRLVEHGGNIDGFAAAVGLLPESNLGFVLLTNTGYSPLQSQSIGLVFDAMAGDWEVEGEADAVAADNGKEDLEAFTGVYIANYAQFKDERFTVAVEDDGRLSIDIPSQTKYMLKPPGDNGRRDFVDVQGIAASFNVDDDGEVPILRLYQGNLQFEVPREGYEYQVELSLDDLEKYQGTYRFDAMNADVSVLIKNNHLAVDVPKQMVFELHPPDDEGKWQFRNNDVMKIFVTFNEGEFGVIESMTFNQMGQEFELPRTGDASGEDLPSLEAVFEIAQLEARQAALESNTIVHMTGTVRFVNAGLPGTMTLTCDADDRARSDMNMGKFGVIRTSLDGDRAFADISFDEFDELTGNLLDTAKRDHPVSFLGDWRSLYDEIRVTGASEIEERKVFVLSMKRGELPTVTAYLDAETGDIVKFESATEIPGLGGMTLPITTYLNDWREVEGLRVPFDMTVETQMNGRMHMTVETVEMNATVAEDYFTLTRSDVPESVH